MPIEVFNRYEKKYFLNDQQLFIVLLEIEKHMAPDKHNRTGQTYSISNIYYDTADDYLIRTSLAHPSYKEKLRLRTYGIPDAEGEAFLEIKKKVNGLVNKRRAAIGLQQAYQFMEERGLEGCFGQVMKELSYMVNRYELMPKVMIAYDRLAYFEKGNPDLRISFDTNIRSRRNDLRLEDGNYGRLIVPRGYWLMEIKTATAMPLWLASLLSREEIRRVSFSKYGREYKQHLEQPEAPVINSVYKYNMGKDGLKQCWIQ